MSCEHYYFYWDDGRFGLTQVRISSWFPFDVHVVLNGREWLACQMDAKGIDYLRRDNCFVRNRDVRTYLFGETEDLVERRRASGRISRKRAMLCADGLINGTSLELPQSRFRESNVPKQRLGVMTEYHITDRTRFSAGKLTGSE